MNGYGQMNGWMDEWMNRMNGWIYEHMLIEQNFIIRVVVVPFFEGCRLKKKSLEEGRSS